MTAFKNTGRAAHTLPKNIKARRALQRDGPNFNSKIKGVNNGRRSFKKLGKVTKKSNKYGQYLKDGQTKFSMAKLKPNDVSRVYQPAVVLGYQRCREQQNPNRTLVEIIGCKTKDDARFYLGKRVLFVTSGVNRKKEDETERRTLVGKVVRTHGNSGVVRVKWARNITPNSFGKKCRVLLYPAKN